jgi:hypothetical protein
VTGFAVRRQCGLWRGHAGSLVADLPHDVGVRDFGKEVKMGSAQIDVKISFEGRQPNKESAAKPLCRYVSPATALHTKRNVILDAWRSLKRLNFELGKGVLSTAWHRW